MQVKKYFIQSVIRLILIWSLSSNSPSLIASSWYKDAALLWFNSFIRSLFHAEFTVRQVLNDFKSSEKKMFSGRWGTCLEKRMSKADIFSAPIVTDEYINGIFSTPPQLLTKTQKVRRRRKCSQVTTLSAVEEYVLDQRKCVFCFREMVGDVGEVCADIL